LGDPYVIACTAGVEGGDVVVAWVLGVDVLGGIVVVELSAIE
jgi:hypothetical protein